MLYEILDELKNTIITNISEIKTCKIGLESGISASDVPFVRVIPVEDNVDERMQLNITVDVVVGTLQLSDLEETYKKHLTIKDKLIKILDEYQLELAGVVYTGGVYDSDEVENFKISILRFELTGVELW